MIQGLRVEIKEIYKANIDQRFNPDNAKKYGDYYFIDIPCKLCRYYKKGPKVIQCSANCPFNKYKKYSIEGCMIWIFNINDMAGLRFTKKNINWDARNNNKSRRKLKKLREEAEKYIRWIK